MVTSSTSLLSPTSGTDDDDQDRSPHSFGQSQIARKMSASVRPFSFHSLKTREKKKNTQINIHDATQSEPGGLVDPYIQFDSSSPVSTCGQTCTLAVIQTLLLYTTLMIAVISMQTNTIHVTVRAICVIVAVHNGLSFIALGMMVKMQLHSQPLHLSTGALHSTSLEFHRHKRNDRCTLLLVLNAIISFVTVVDLLYVAQLVVDVDVSADNFRDTGINSFMHRSLDLVFTLLFVMAGPMLLLVATQARFLHSIVFTGYDKKQLNSIKEHTEEDEADSD